MSTLLKAPKLKKGMRVKIYNDPLTRQKPEGYARLVKCLDSNFGIYNGHTVERWSVVFDISVSHESVEREIMSVPGIVEE